MQNKGFVITLASLLFLICAFYLSFSFVTSRYDDRAREYAQGDNGKYYDYMDSVSSQEVWMGYTLKECREKEINLGLDLKGGMNVTLEVSVVDVVRALSDYNTNVNFNKALAEANKRQVVSGDNFLKLFQEEFEKIDPNARLAGIFSTYDFKDRISSSATNDEVIAVLQTEVDAAIANSFNVLRTRIDRFGVVQPNIQQLDKEGRILVELPGVKEPERVRKLLQGSANLEFWETFKYSEVAPQLEAANNIIRDMNKAKEGEVKEVEESEEIVTEEVAEVVENNVAEVETNDTATADDEVDQILSSLENDSTVKEKEDEQMSEEEIRREYPLFSRLQPQQNNGPVLGLCRASDTAEVNSMLALKQVAELFPRELRFKWTVKPINPNDKVPYYQLIAIKCSNRDGRAPLSGDVITDARDDFSQYSASSTVSMKMNAEGSKIWARLTKENIGREIAIVLDNYVYSFPTVNTEITGGSSEISGNFTPEEAKDLANVLKSGKMPAPARIIQEDVVGPSLGEEAIQSGLISFIIAFVLVLIYMLFYYGVVPGLIADGALLINVLFLFGILASFRAVLTLPGIAGIVLTLGMAVDANVLIYERIREELRSGKNFKSAINDGYSNAFSAIADANITTLITGIILLYFGTGPIKGFATTLIIGIVTSVFSSVFLTRVVYDFIVKSEKDRRYSFTTAITKKWFQNVNFDFIGKRKIGYIISGCIIVIAIVSLGFRGLKQGIDFSGGRNYVVRFEQPVNTDEVREILSNITYTGNLLLQKYYIADPIIKKEKKNTGELNQYYVENSHEAIISMEQFEAVQKEFERRNKLGQRANQSLHITCFTSKVKCPLCGKSYRRSGKKNRMGKNYTYYVWVCRTKSEKGAKYCGAKVIPEEELKIAACNALGWNEFDSDLFDETIEKVVPIGEDMIEFYPYDGGVIKQEWHSTARQRGWNEERKRTTTEKRLKTLEARKNAKEC